MDEIASTLKKKAAVVAQKGKAYAQHAFQMFFHWFYRKKQIVL